MTQHSMIEKKIRFESKEFRSEMEQLKLKLIINNRKTY